VTNEELKVLKAAERRARQRWLTTMQPNSRAFITRSFCERRTRLDHRVALAGLDEGAYPAVVVVWKCRPLLTHQFVLRHQSRQSVGLKLCRTARALKLVLAPPPVLPTPRSVGVGSGSGAQPMTTTNGRPAF